MSQYRKFDPANSRRIFLTMLTFSDLRKASAAFGHHMVTRRREGSAIWINPNFTKYGSINPQEIAI